MSGFIYGSLGRRSDDCAARLDWVAHADEGYLPGAYDQLAAVYANAGREEDVRRVAIAKHQQRRSHLSLIGRVWNRFLEWTVGYGYRTWLAGLWLIAFVLGGWGIFASAWPSHMDPLKSQDQLPDFHAWLYSIDAVLPVIRLGQEDSWVPTGGALAWYTLSVVAGWVLVTTALAALTAAAARRL